MWTPRIYSEDIERVEKTDFVFISVGRDTRVWVTGAEII